MFHHNVCVDYAAYVLEAPVRKKTANRGDKAFGCGSKVSLVLQRLWLPLKIIPILISGRITCVLGHLLIKAAKVAGGVIFRF